MAETHEPISVLYEKNYHFFSYNEILATLSTRRISAKVKYVTTNTKLYSFRTMALVKAVLNVSQVIASKMIQNNIKGSIVNISSQASKVRTKIANWVFEIKVLTFSGSTQS